MYSKDLTPAPVDRRKFLVSLAALGFAFGDARGRPLKPPETGLIQVFRLQRHV